MLVSKAPRSMIRSLSSACRCLCIASSSSSMPLMKKKDKGTVNEVTEFVDRKRIQVEGGKGGDGCVSLARLFANDHAGPDGGDGGNGGHVMFKATMGVRSLAHLTPIIRGNPGENGHSSNCHGKNADHLIIEVPVGTMFKNENGDVIADLTEAENSLFVAARGGAGGRGNKFFATPENQSPEIAEYGAKGEKLKYIAEMATIAHFGLLGYPNAGKSTLLQAISRARPKVASYPFTTLRPHVGIIQYDDLEQLAVADIPGIISDAHLNRGLGIQFLRHIQRCLCLIYVIDLTTENPTPFEVYETLRSELRHYNASMLDRPSIIAVNKWDMPEAKENFEEFKKRVGDSLLIIPISAKYGINLKDLLIRLRQVYDENSTKKEKEILEKYEPVKEQNTRRQWRRSSSNKEG